MSPYRPKQPPKSKPKKIPKRLALLLIVLILAAALAVAGHLINHTPAKNSGAVTFNKSKYSINDPNSIWLVVNKGRILPNNYAPADLVVPNVPLRLSASDPEMHMRQAAATALEQMTLAASRQNINLMLSSGYRSYDEQVGLYKGYVANQGQQSADSSSARPGHSEHQTGLAADLEPAGRNCEVELCFADTAEGKWLDVNAYKYGFIIRYQKGQEKLTGYQYEPWHVRFVGTALAAQIQKSGQTLEQFFNLPTYADYPVNSYRLAAGK